MKTGIRRNVSFGYRYNNIKWVEERDGTDVFSVENADALEVSIVAVPADFTVGIGRAEGEVSEEARKEFFNIVQKRKEEENMGRRVSGGSQDQGEIETPKPMAAEPMARREDEHREMLALGKQFNLLTMAAEYIESKRSLEDLRGAILSKIQANHVQNPGTYKANETSQLEQRELDRYSLKNIIMAASDPNFRGGGYEREISEQAKRERGMSARSGVIIPAEVYASIAMRDTSKTLMATPQADKAQGAAAVATNTLGSDFIRSFYPASVMLQLGARGLTSLTGNVSIPKQTNSVAAEWVPEGVSPQGSRAAIGQVPMAPKRVAAFTEYSRQFLVQASIDVEEFIRDDMRTKVGLAIDAAAIMGPGTNNEPLGLLQNPEVAELRLDANTLDFGAIVDMETEVTASNATGPRMAYLTNSRVRGYLKTLPEGGNIQQRCWTLGDINTGDGVLNGYRAMVSNQIMGGTGSNLASMLYGDFSQVWIGEWGGLYLETNPWILQQAGIIRIHIEAMIDVAVRHTESFCVIKNIDVSKFPDFSKGPTNPTRIAGTGGGTGGGTTEGGGGAIRRRTRSGNDE